MGTCTCLVGPNALPCKGEGRTIASWHGKARQAERLQVAVRFALTSPPSATPRPPISLSRLSPRSPLPSIFVPKPCSIYAHRSFRSFHSLRSLRADPSFIDALAAVLDPDSPRPARRGTTTSVLRHEISTAGGRRFVVLDTPGLPLPYTGKRHRALNALTGIVEARLAHQLSEENKVVRRKSDGAELVHLSESRAGWLEDGVRSRSRTRDRYRRRTRAAVCDAYRYVC
jgi:hypothetical protein